MKKPGKNRYTQTKTSLKASPRRAPTVRVTASTTSGIHQYCRRMPSAYAAAASCSSTSTVSARAFAGPTRREKYSAEKASPARNALSVSATACVVSTKKRNRILAL